MATSGSKPEPHSPGTVETEIPLLSHKISQIKGENVNENASTISNALPVLQQAHHTQGGAGETGKSIIHDQNRAAEEATERYREQWKVLKSPWWRQADQEGSSQIPVHRMQQGTCEKVFQSIQIRTGGIIMAKSNENITPAPKSRFLRVKCTDCENEQVVFGSASTHVQCVVCGRALVEPKGGRAKILAPILEVLE
jgi:small subunit ribosomal protein S27e